MGKIELFGISFSDMELSTAVEEIVHRVSLREKTYIVTPNVDHVLRFQKDKKFREIYTKAGLVLADGWPVVLASRLLGRALPGQVAGSDLFEKLCSAVQGSYSVYFLGGSSGTPEVLKEKFNRSYPRLRIAGVHSPSPQELNMSEGVTRIIEHINSSGADILFVGLGSPKQEYFIYDNWAKLNIKIGLGVGIALDYSAGVMPRAPLWLRKIGLEWLYRLIREPRRLFWRYFRGIVLFPLLCIKELFTSREDCL